MRLLLSASMFRCATPLFFLLMAMSSVFVTAAGNPVDQHNVVWTTPAKSPADLMPLGNGSLGINTGIEENGDLIIYLGRNDSFSEISQLCKVGRVRISFSPNPLRSGVPFRQELRLREGVCEVRIGEGDDALNLKIFVDADHPVVHVQGSSGTPVAVKAFVESWRTAPQEVPGESAWTLSGGPIRLVQAADFFPKADADAVTWYHRNESTLAFDETVKVQSLEPIRASMKDPLLHRTFGGWVTGDGFIATDERTLASRGPVTGFQLRIASPCEQTDTADAWLKLAKNVAGETKDGPARLARTAAWWGDFWDRSWVDCATGPVQKIPANTHPVRAGVDSDGGNRFPGTLGGLSLLGTVLSPEEIAALASASPVTAAPTAITAPDFSKGLTIEGWIRPESESAGRILDKLTAGRNDGFLLDIQPKQRLRFIMGDVELSTPENTLATGRWQHVAATYDATTSAVSLFVDGKPVLEKPFAFSPTGITRHGLFLGQEEPAAHAPEMTVGKAHTLQRYMQACAGRSQFPIKFNGSLFTVEPAALGIEANADFRRWGDCYWWQNTRMPYHAMQAAGDFDLMMPLFDFFESIRPFAEARTKLYHDAEGAYFAETMNAWGAYANRDYGWDRKGKEPRDVDCLYWRYAWNQGLELVALMLDYYDYTGDEPFLKERLLPMASSVLKYFDTRFRKDASGRIILDPTQSVETYWHDVINDTPSVAGLNDLATRLCALPAEVTTEEQRRFFSHMKAAAPPVPIENAKMGNEDVRRIAVAEKYNPKRSNVENPELFPVWPFRIFGLERPMLEEARNAFALRGNHNDVGWGYDSNAAALLGLTDEAARMLKAKLGNSNAAYRWPATWGPNFDWLPDQCHGGNLMATVNYMLLQHAGEKILIFPAWPREWDASFKLHAPNQTTVEATLQGGRITRLNVTPESRAKDVIVPPGWQ